MVRKRAKTPTMEMVFNDSPAVTLTLDEDLTFEVLRSKLAEINKTAGINGYILRNPTTAVIDLQNPTKLFEYALLSSETTDCCQKLSELFELGTTEVVLEGSEAKMFCKIIGENKLSIFMEKNVNLAKVIGRIQR